MGLRQRIASIFNRTVTAPPDPGGGGVFYVPWAWIPDGLRLSPHEAMQVGAVYACVRIISQVIASSPWNIEEVVGGKTTSKPDDPIAYLLNTRPNADMTAQSALAGLIVQELIFGDSFAEIAFDASWRVTGIHPLLSERMLPPERDEAGQLYYRYADANGGVKALPSWRVLHYRGLSIDGLLGQGVVRLASRSIAHYAAVEKFGLAYFANAATPSGVLSTPKSLSKDEREALKAEFTAKHTGDRKNGTPMVLANGTEWSAISNDPQKSQMAETRPQTVEEISRWFGVPLHLLSDPKGAQGYGRNLGELGLQFVRYTLSPICKDIEQESRFKLIRERSSRVVTIDLTHLTLGTAKECAETDEIRIRSGVITPNEARRRAGYNTGPDELDRHFASSSLTTVERAIEGPPPPPALPAPAEPEDEEEEEPDEDDAPPGPLAPPRAVMAAFTLALKAHARAWTSRRRDVETRSDAAAVPGLLAEARAELRERLTFVLAGLEPGVDLAQLADAVEQGADPAKTAAHFLGARA